MCILSVYALLKVVGYYDLRVLSMSVMRFHKKSLDGGWVGGVSSIQFFLDFWNFFNFAKPLSRFTNLYKLFTLTCRNVSTIIRAIQVLRDALFRKLDSTHHIFTLITLVCTPSYKHRHTPHSGAG